MLLTFIFAGGAALSSTSSCYKKCSERNELHWLFSAGDVIVAEKAVVRTFSMKTIVFYEDGLPSNSIIMFQFMFSG